MKTPTKSAVLCILASSILLLGLTTAAPVADPLAESPSRIFEANKKRLSLKKKGSIRAISTHRRTDAQLTIEETAECASELFTCVAQAQATDANFATALQWADPQGILTSAVEALFLTLSGGSGTIPILPAVADIFYLLTQMEIGTVLQNLLSNFLPPCDGSTVNGNAGILDDLTKLPNFSFVGPLLDLVGIDVVGLIMAINDNLVNLAVNISNLFRAQNNSENLIVSTIMRVFMQIFNDILNNVSNGTLGLGCGGQEEVETIPVPTPPQSSIGKAEEGQEKVETVPDPTPPKSSSEKSESKVPKGGKKQRKKRKLAQQNTSEERDLLSISFRFEEILKTLHPPIQADGTISSFDTKAIVKENTKVMSTEMKAVFDKMKVIASDSRDGSDMGALSTALNLELIMSINSRLIEFLSGLNDSSQTQSDKSGPFEYLGEFVKLAANTYEQDPTGEFFTSGLVDTTISLVIFEGTYKFSAETFPAAFALAGEPQMEQSIERIENELSVVLRSMDNVLGLKADSQIPQESIDDIVDNLNCRLELIACETTNSVLG